MFTDPFYSPGSDFIAIGNDYTADLIVRSLAEKGYGLIPRMKKGPALAGYEALTMADALKKTVTTYPRNCGDH